MRRLTALSICFLLLGADAGCKKPKRVRATASNADEPFTPDTTPRSVVHVADPKSAIQLIRGFHEVEGNAWRWTKGSFAVTLRTPANAARNGAWLVMKLAVPESVIEHTERASLAANIAGFPIPAVVYSKGGEYTYRKEVPPGALTKEAVTVEFALDRYIAPGKVEDRELGIIVSMVGLESK
jgi:hypothetical protein